MRTQEQIDKTVEWITALRDPTRTQTKGRLRDNRGMCCLGVLCDVVDPTAWQWPNEGSKLAEWGPRRDDYMLSGRVMELFGISQADQEHFSHLNDAVGLPFSRIADVVEAWNTKQGEMPTIPEAE